MTPQEFITKWQAVTLSERSACQQHFLDLCELLEQPKPAAADPEGAWYCFERGVTKTEGGKGWADVWMKDRFGWEYKGKHKDLKAAYNQLLQYHESLDSPPLLVVCDMDRFEIHTKFIGAAKKVYEFDLAGLGEPKNLETLRRLFTDPDSLKPGITSRTVTEQASEHFGRLADGMRMRGVEAHDAAHFLMKLMFCMFAEDIELLPNQIFTKALKQSRNEPERLTKFLRELFEAMAHGGQFALEDILYFNGGLFSDSAPIELHGSEIPLLIDAASFDWSVVEPHIFGTLFERTLDPAKRSQIGAHYTSSEDIETLLEPVMMTPLRREWAQVQQKCEKLLPKLKAEAKKRLEQQRRSTKPAKDTKTRRDFNKHLRDFIERLGHVSVLDPACGSGNFLYVALRLLLDLEKQVITYAAPHGLGLLPQVRPTQLHGIEINPFAQELAQVVIWIGYLQWMRDNGFNPPRDPVLEPIESIENRDAILDLSDPENPKEPEWPPAEFIVGNPPFLGSQKLRRELDDSYVTKLFKLWGSRVPNGADLCCYWFEKARDAIIQENCSRAGLLATQGIRGGANNEVLRRISRTASIFFGISDRMWILEGANVHISMVGFDSGVEVNKFLDSKKVESIQPNLSGSRGTATVRRLRGNGGIAFQGPVRVGPFDVSVGEACEMLSQPNPTSRLNSDVLRPTLNGTDVVKRDRERWVIDFYNSDIECAASYEEPLRIVKERVKPSRDRNREKSRREHWWHHGRTGDDLRGAIGQLHRYLAMAQTAKFFNWRWYSPIFSPEQTIIAIASDQDAMFGYLHSQPHLVWAYTLSTRLETRPRYTPTTCFETFPFPEPTDAQRETIAAAAKELNELREGWLNPPEWTKTEVLTFPGSPDGPWARYVEDGVVHYPRLVPKDEECAKQLKKRTLTNLYNQRPTWLDLAHKRLDKAVLAAYGWPADISDDDLLAKLLELNLARAAAENAH